FVSNTGWLMTAAAAAGVAEVTVAAGAEVLVTADTLVAGATSFVAPGGVGGGGNAFRTNCGPRNKSAMQTPMMMIVLRSMCEEFGMRRAECGVLCRHRVAAATTPRMTPAKSFRREPATDDRAALLHGFHCVSRATWRKSTTRARPE